MHIAILDDEELDIACLSRHLARYGQEQRLALSLLVYTTAQALLEAASSTEIHIAFLDIFLQGMSGMDAARRLASEYPQCRLVFATSSSAHAVESYAVRAAYYLTKPLDYETVSAAMDVACADLRRDSQCVQLSHGGVKAHIPLKEILYLDSVRKRAVLHLSGQNLLVDQPVSEALSLLLGHSRFLQCNRNLVLNMDHVSSMDSSSFLLDNGERLLIRQHGRSEVRQSYMNYRMKLLG